MGWDIFVNGISHPRAAGRLRPASFSQTPDYLMVSPRLINDAGGATT